MTRRSLVVERWGVGEPHPNAVAGQLVEHDDLVGVDAGEQSGVEDRLGARPGDQPGQAAAGEPRGGQAVRRRASGQHCARNRP